MGSTERSQAYAKFRILGDDPQRESEIGCRLGEPGLGLEKRKKSAMCEGCAYEL